MAKTKKKKFDTINEALAFHKLGALNEANVRHAYGVTDKEKRVWLPIISKNGQHTNILLKKDGVSDLILETGAKAPQKINPDMETAHVITREIINRETIYEYIGKYKQVLFDKERAFTVHAKVPFSKPDGFLWDNTFVSSLKEAKKKTDELYQKRYQISQI